MEKKRQEQINVWGRWLVCVLVDTVVMAMAYLTAFLLRFDFNEPWWGWRKVASSFITVWAVQWLSLILFGCYKLVWRYVSVVDVPRFVGAILASTGVLVILRLALPAGYAIRPPYSINLFNGILLMGGLLGVRLLWRFMVDGEFAWEAVKRGRMRKVLLVGAGAAGNLVARELRRQSVQRLEVVGFLDDDPSKKYVKIQGHAVLGGIEDLPIMVKKYGVDEVIVSMVQVTRDVIRRVVLLCEQANIAVRIVPGYYELIDGSMTASKIRNVDVADLLGREETHSDSAPIIALIGSKRVLVTGAGGTIGSELTRQIFRTGPELLLLVERSENALYEIEREIRHLGGATPVVAVLADIADACRMEEVFKKYRPQVVVHAAAYKHVPMMEQNPVEAVRNNVLATRALGELAVAHAVERFVFISTDKAVKPVSVMGITKRFGEIALQDLNFPNGTLFSAVRFGNVMDSSGSVVPLFREQILKGESVTVTHPEMTRYFMTISEAVSLVLQAAVLAQGGEIFVLDMGEPIKILELAEEMIALSGLKPYEDIPISFTGIRPGEKLFEEVDVSERSVLKTGHARIFISRIHKVNSSAVAHILNDCRRICANRLENDVVRIALVKILSLLDKVGEGAVKSEV